VLQALKQRLPCVPWRRPWWSRYFLAALGDDHAGAAIHNAVHGGPHAAAGGYLLKQLQSVESPCCSRFVLKDCSPWMGPMLEQKKGKRRKEQQTGTAID